MANQNKKNLRPIPLFIRPNLRLPSTSPPYYQIGPPESPSELRFQRSKQGFVGSFPTGRRTLVGMTWRRLGALWR
ncbi:hypothetical protein V6Z11_A03G068800 [Gossypium hirsutum]